MNLPDNVKEALSTLICAADVRQDQWQAAADSDDGEWFEHALEEINESDHDECQNMADLLGDAIATVQKWLRS